MTTRLQNVLRDLIQLAASDEPQFIRHKKAKSLLAIVDDMSITSIKVRKVMDSMCVPRIAASKLLMRYDGDLERVLKSQSARVS